MLNQKKYSCGICKTTPDQISHHKSHIETQKHKDKKELFELKLYKLSDEELMNKYKTTNINDICDETETILYSTIDNVKNDMKYNDFQDIQDIMEKQNCISNKEALKEKIHEIHNYLRNNGAGYGMNALKVFNILYGLKKIEENNLIDCVGLKRPVCEFSYLLSLANENKDEELASLIYRDVLDAINESKINKLLFYEIPKNMKGNVFPHLIKEINNITKIEKSCNVLLSGKIYEYFIGRDESAISELGAYFTDRHIVEYIYKKLDPCINEDGSISTMIDMFGGSGGFTTGYINYLNEKYPKGINWESELNKISHFDMNEDVIKSAGLEFFCLTGIIPDMKHNLGYKNSFTDNFVKDNKKYKKYKYPITNPPYGGDKNSKTVAQEKGEKIKEYIKNELNTITDEGIRIARQKQLKSIEARDKQDKNEINKTKVCVSSCSDRIIEFARVNQLYGNDKESCSLMLLMDILEVGGTAIGVLKEGVFFNKTYKDIRKCLVENYNVREIISIPQDQFENTSTKTSIIIFDNIENKTKEVKFYDLVVNRYDKDKFVEDNGVIIITENKGDISGISDTIISVATREEILSNAICSLNGKDYNKKVIVYGEGYKLVKIGDICEFLPKSKRKASEGKKTGKYNFYTSSEKIQRCDVADYKDECLIIGDGGVANIQIDKDFSCSDHNHIIKTDHNKYIYYILSGKIELLIDGFTGSVLKNLSKEYLLNMQIPIPKSDKKIIEWVDKISKPYEEKNRKQNKINELEENVKNRIKDIVDNEECDELELGRVCKFINGKKRVITDGKSYGLYPLFSSSLVVDNWIDEYDYNVESIIINTINGSGKFNLQYASKYCRTSNTIVFTTENKNLTLYIYYYGLINIETIGYLANGSTKKKMGITEISKFMLLIPKNKELIKDLEPVFDEIEKLQGEVKVAESQYDQLIKELSEEAMPTNSSILLNTTIQELTEANLNTIQNDTKVVQSVKSVKSSRTSTGSIKSLQEQCKSLGIKGYTKYKKKEDKEKLLKLIEEYNE